MSRLHFFLLRFLHFRLHLFRGAARFFEGYVAQKPGRFYGQSLRPNGFAGNFQHFRLVRHQKFQSLFS